MAGNLEDFLQKAAERLSDQVAGNQRPRPARPTRDVRKSERARIDPNQYDEADVPEAILVEDGPNPLSSIDTRRLPDSENPQLAREISQTDERMQDRMHDALDHDLLDLPDASRALEGVHSKDIAHSGSTDVTRRKKSVSPMIAMLRDPQTLRGAFLLSEILHRRKS